MVVFSLYPADPRPCRAAEALLKEGMQVDLICEGDNTHRSGRPSIGWKSSAFRSGTTAAASLPMHINTLRSFRIPRPFWLGVRSGAGMTWYTYITCPTSWS